MFFTDCTFPLKGDFNVTSYDDVIYNSKGVFTCANNQGVQFPNGTTSDKFNTVCQANAQWSDFDGVGCVAGKWKV